VSLGIILGCITKCFVMKITGHTANMGIDMHANKLADNTEGNKPSDRYAHK
jgi:hypothetical protein